MAITVTISGTTAQQRALAFEAWGDYLHPGTNATGAEIEAHFVYLLKKVVFDYRLRQAIAAVPAPPDLEA